MSRGSFIMRSGLLLVLAWLLAMGFCQAAKAQPPEELQVYFCTDRQPIDDCHYSFTNQRADIEAPPCYGKFTFTPPAEAVRTVMENSGGIPTSSKAINKAYMRLLKEQEQLAQTNYTPTPAHFTSLPEQNFFNEIKGHNDIVLFIHGFNTSFETAIINGARLAQHTGKPCVVYCWPSVQSPSLKGYLSDECNIEWTFRHFWNFADKLLECQLLTEDELNRRLATRPLRNVDIVAHSLGNRLLLWYLQRLDGQRAVPVVRMDTLVMTSADVDRQAAEQNKAEASQFSRVRVLISNNDLPLVASRVVHGGHPRLGHPTLVHGIFAPVSLISPLGMTKLDASFHMWPSAVDATGKQTPTFDVLQQQLAKDKRELKFEPGLSIIDFTKMDTAGHFIFHIGHSIPFDLIGCMIRDRHEQPVGWRYNYTVNKPDESEFDKAAYAIKRLDPIWEKDVAKLKKALQSDREDKHGLELLEHGDPAAAIIQFEKAESLSLPNDRISVLLDHFEAEFSKPNKTNAAKYLDGLIFGKSKPDYKHIPSGTPLIFCTKLAMCKNELGEPQDCLDLLDTDFLDSQYHADPRPENADTIVGAYVSRARAHYIIATNFCSHGRIADKNNQCATGLNDLLKAKSYAGSIVRLQTWYEWQKQLTDLQNKP